MTHNKGHCRKDGVRIACPAGHTKVWHKTTVVTRTHGKRERYYCAECGRTFYKDHKVVKQKKKQNR